LDLRNASRIESTRLAARHAQGGSGGARGDEAVMRVGCVR
ncbi:unnamed protein product, partial [Urochloa humidicola]